MKFSVNGKNYVRIPELFCWTCVHDVCTSLFSELSGGEHDIISSDHHVPVVSAIISDVVPKQERFTWREDNVFWSCCSFSRLWWYINFQLLVIQTKDQSCNTASLCMSFLCEDYIQYWYLTIQNSRNWYEIFEKLSNCLFLKKNLALQN